MKNPFNVGDKVRRVYHDLFAGSIPREFGVVVDVCEDACYCQFFYADEPEEWFTKVVRVNDLMFA